MIRGDVVTLICMCDESAVSASANRDGLNSTPAGAADDVNVDDADAVCKAPAGRAPVNWGSTPLPPPAAAAALTAAGPDRPLLLEADDDEDVPGVRLPSPAVLLTGAGEEREAGTTKSFSCVGVLR